MNRSTKPLAERARSVRRANSSINHRAVGLLGVLTIVAYGTWFFSFGVLLDPIRLDTGWSESFLAGSFSVGIAAVGLTSAWAGLLLDRLGSRPVFLLGGVGATVGLLIASVATQPLVFLAASALAMVSLGSLGFYHITMTAAVRANTSMNETDGKASARAISILTIWGAFSSAIYLPGTAALVDLFDWRVTVRILAGLALVTFLAAAAAIKVPPAVQAGQKPSLSAVFRTALSSRSRRALTLAIALGGVAMSTVLVYQVPAMTAAGLPLATAATLAGVRGFLQILGRIPLAPLVAWIGSTRTLIAAFIALGVGGALLAVAGSVPIGIAFALLAGFGLGAFPALQGIKTEELYDNQILGGVMGFNGSVLMVAGAIGPIVAGALADAAGDRRVVGPIILIAGLAAALTALGTTDPPTAGSSQG